MTGLMVAVPGPSLSKPHSTGKILYSFENWGSQESELLSEGCLGVGVSVHVSVDKCNASGKLGAAA